jgi:hypothetical protein
MARTQTQSSGGIGLSGAMFLLFLGLKLGKVITWSWLWVTAPLWVPLAIVVVVGIIVAAYVWVTD